jgi:hypothetical protein
MFVSERKRIALFAMAERLPTTFGFRETVEDWWVYELRADLRESWRPGRQQTEARLQRRNRGIFIPPLRRAKVVF